MMRLIVLLGAVLLAACAEPQKEAPPPRAVLVREIGAGTAPAGLNVYTGEVRPRIEADLAFRIGGKVIERRVDVGAEVKRGDVLARLDPQDVQLAARAATAQVAAAKADVALAQAEYERTKELRQRNFISDSALDSRRTALEAATAKLRQARAQAASAANQTDYASLVADRDGVVTAALAEAGQVVAAGQPVFRVARPGEREVLIYVPEGRVGALAPGTPAQVRPWAAPGRDYAGRVREVAPAADPATRTYAVRVSVPKADAALPLGATASVAFADPSLAQAVLPLPAVTRIEGRATVWVVDDASRVQPVTVVVGAYREDGAVIESGLPARARVVVAGVQKLVPGERVRPVAQDAPVALDVGR